MTTLFTHDLDITAFDVEVGTPHERCIGAIQGFFYGEEEAQKLIDAFGVELKATYDEEEFGPLIRFVDPRAHFLVEHDGTKGGKYVFTIVIQSHNRIHNMWTIIMSHDSYRTPRFVLELKGGVDKRQVITALMLLGFKQVGTITIEED